MRIVVCSKHHPTVQLVTRAGVAAGFTVEQRTPAEDASGVAALLVVDLDLDLSTSATAVVTAATAKHRGVPVLAVAGTAPRTRLFEVLSQGVDRVLEKRRTPIFGGQSSEGTGPGGPDPFGLFCAMRSLINAKQGGLEPYLLGGATTFSGELRSTQERDAHVERVRAWAGTLGLKDERAHRLGLVTEELLMNAFYNAPTTGGVARHATRPRDQPVTLEGREVIRYQLGCDGTHLGVAVTDPFGSLRRAALTARMCRTGSLVPAPDHVGGGLGLLTTFEAVNHLVFSVEPGRRTEVVALLHVAGSNLEAQSRGQGLEFRCTRAEDA